MINGKQRPGCRRFSTSPARRPQTPTMTPRPPPARLRDSAISADNQLRNQVGMRSSEVLVGSVFAAIVAAGIAFAGMLAITVPAQAQGCPGHPDALGTSRVLMLQPNEPRQFGLMQYPQTLPLADKEVVLTFDDGPLPPYSNEVLDILAAQCVKATYFLIGGQARAFPGIVRRIHADGHTIGTHTEDHPLRMGRLSSEQIRWEIDRGIADVAAALGDPKKVAPFFRIPGLLRSPAIEDELAARGLVVFSADAVADDWHRRIKPTQIIARAISRLEARGKGILLLHDIHRATVAALPGLLRELKEKGFHVVHVVPGPALVVAAANAAAALPPASANPPGDDHASPAGSKLVTAAANCATLAASRRPHVAASYRSLHRAAVADRVCSRTAYRHCRHVRLARSVQHRLPRHRLGGPKHTQLFEPLQGRRTGTAVAG